MTLPSTLGVFASAVHITGGGPVDGYVSSASSTNNATTYTFTSQPIGTAAANRRVVVGVAGRDTAAFPTSVTVGGTGLTMDEGETNTPVCTIWSGVIATGGTATIVVTYAVANTYCGIGVWDVYGKSAAATAKNTSNSTTPVATITTVAGDFCVGMLAYRINSGTTPAFTWTAANERFDAAGDGAVRMFAGADLVASGTSTAMGGTITNPFSTTESALVAVAYR